MQRCDHDSLQYIPPHEQQHDVILHDCIACGDHRQVHTTDAHSLTREQRERINKAATAEKRIMLRRIKADHALRWFNINKGMLQVGDTLRNSYTRKKLAVKRVRCSMDTDKTAKAT